ncbi:sugar phosphate isomerase/epimerase [Acetobacterium sp. K1/6]|uniref:sugar phosphate isomerase/epimerase family protein n=1 Tax=Acetobacterium sp. K1/6 TaxID=3055467 RepID=UPI002ACA1A04|nr:sugar phosphate isomerase/epimerase [Acetobacterium sp. K1/6]MDZ5725098.1 sugar phosphate isomerase/epimerase [Acetobacterium sp. K1/6]
MNYSMFSWFGYFMPFEERIKIIAGAGFDEAMISWEDEFEPWPLKKEEFPEIVRKNGLGITNIHAPFIGYSDIWTASRTEIKPKLTEFIGFIKDCQDFEIPAMVMHTNDLDEFTPDLDKGLAFFSELADAAEKYGVDLAVENVSRQHLLDFLLEQINAPRFGMCYDSSHDFLEEQNRGRILKKHKHRIKALHLSDNDFKEDRHWIPGEGSIPLDEVLAEILTVPTINTISYEVLANEAWREKEPLDFAVAVKKSLVKK